MNSVPPQPAVERYRQQLQITEANLHRHHRSSRRLVAVRMLLFLAAGYLLFRGYWSAHPSNLWIILGWLMAVAFLVAAAAHEWIQQTIQRQLIERRLYRRLIARVDRDWAELGQHTDSKQGFETLDTADDLDLTGDRSLFSWCSLAGTHAGRHVLFEQLTSYADSSTIQERQNAVRELAPQHEIRQRLMMQLWQLGSSPVSLEEFSEWAATPRVQNRWLGRLTWIGPMILLSGVAVLFAAISLNLSSAVAWIGVGLSTLGLLINIFLVLGFVGVLHNAFKRMTTHHELESTCQQLLESLVQLQPSSTLLQELQTSLCDPASKKSAVVALAKLRWPMRLAGLRLHPTLYILFLVFQICLLWDFRIYEWIERWRAQYALEVPRWLASIGKLEAILSASAIKDEYPEWSTPDFDLPVGVLFQAKRLGHPLLTDRVRVTNDLKIDEARPLLLVTGSNMSGKSTLMRAVGVNVALSRIGSPVCAEKCACPPLEIATSIRVRDSLADGVSFFMAELKRLRQVVDAVRQSYEEHKRRSLVILDEILQGTNSQERQIAVSHVVQTLHDLHAIIMVSTHDLQLADIDGFSNNSQIVHFREHFEDRDGQSLMLFDYRMHPGIAPTTNALKLLELVGLGNSSRNPVKNQVEVERSID